jgi:DNA-binding NarL/FixJ family response regulator
MGLHLASRDIQRYRDTSEALLSPLRYDTPAAWCEEVLRRVEALFHADRAMLVLPVEGHVKAYSQNIPPAGLTQLQSAVSAMVPGGFSSERSKVDTVFRGRRAAGLHVWHNEALANTTGLSLDSIPFYHEVMIPNGVAYGSGMVTSLPLGEAWLSIAHSRPSDDPFGIEGGLELLRMLYPSFTAGVQCIITAPGQRRGLTHALEAFGEAVVAFDMDGRELHRSGSLQQILSEECEPEILVAAVTDLATTVTRLCRPVRKATAAPVGPSGAREVSTSAATYDLSGAFVNSGAGHSDGGVLIRVQRRSVALPSQKSLCVRYGLTPRESEVALHLARGASNREVARRLHVSPSTVRTHVEHIFEKLGIHSRKALALELVA